ncbi:acyltransferase family protein [Svornostia abyssi]|uniref:Acyltransferase family protein n=1 Tax=Svornostia abyssi TaxID=2898438 RepID=A0ABY5PMZ5_9ACTN|nr:acyltransferase family protein [Parviterribacteraceae bacterium J379]
MTTRRAPDTGEGSGSAPGGIAGAVARRAADWSVEEPNFSLLAAQMPFWNVLMDHYFRMEIEGFHRLPAEPALLVGVHAGGALTMDAWTLALQWHRRFGRERILHPTAHDVLMATPGLGEYFRAMGVIPPTTVAMSAALDAGHDVVLWPGGEQDAMRSWRKRDRVVLAGRRGFVRFAIRHGVPIVPVASVGCSDTVFVLSEGRFLARWTGLGKRLRGATLPIISGFPFPLALEILPMHIPLPAKIRTELLEPIDPGCDPALADDDAYVDRTYTDIERALQAGMDRLASRRSFPIFG